MRFALQTADGGMLQALTKFRVLRGFRLLRLVARARLLRDCVECIVHSIPDIIQVSIVLLLIGRWYSILGVLLYSGTFYSCTATDFRWQNRTFAVGDWLDCVAAARAQWICDPSHFDDVGSGMRCVVRGAFILCMYVGE